MADSQPVLEVVEAIFESPVRKRVFFSHLYIKMLILPRQARDKHRENSKNPRVSAGCAGSDAELQLD